MPRLTLKSVLLRAIQPAVEDRISYAECYQEDAPERKEALSDARAVRLLKEVLTKHKGSIELLPVPTQTLCFSVLVWAAQHEQSVADANHNKGEFARRARADSRLFETTRLQYFGESAMELAVKNTVAVNIADVLEGARSAPPGASSQDILRHVLKTARKDDASAPSED